MNSTAKVLIPNKEWLLRDEKQKIGSIAKTKKGYIFLKNGHQIKFKSLNEVTTEFGVTLTDEISPEQVVTIDENKVPSIYDFPCSSDPYEPVYDVKKKLPLFSKSGKSKSQYCAGYYVIRFRKGWVKSFCPKLITLDRYPFQGPFKTESEMKTVLNTVNKA
jgi:hypothetical protein